MPLRITHVDTKVLVLLVQAIPTCLHMKLGAPNTRSQVRHLLYINKYVKLGAMLSLLYSLINCIVQSAPDNCSCQYSLLRVAETRSDIFRVCQPQIKLKIAKREAQLNARIASVTLRLSARPPPLPIAKQHKPGGRS